MPLILKAFDMSRRTPPMFHDTQSTNDAPVKFRSWHPLPALAGKIVRSIPDEPFGCPLLLREQPAPISRNLFPSIRPPLHSRKVSLIGRSVTKIESRIFLNFCYIATEFLYFFGDFCYTACQL